VVTIEGIDDPVFGRREATEDELQGITFVGPRGVRVELRNAAGETIKSESVEADGRQHVGIAWRALAFPDIGGEHD